MSRNCFFFSSYTQLAISFAPLTRTHDTQTLCIYFEHDNQKFRENICIYQIYIISFVFISLRDNVGLFSIFQNFFLKKNVSEIVWQSC